MRRFRLSTLLLILSVAAPVAWAARSISVLVNVDTELLTITTGTLIYGDDHAVTVTRSSGTFATDRTYRLTVKRAGQYNQAAYSYYTAGTVTTSALTFASVNLNVTALGQDLGDRPSIDVMLDVTDGTDTTYGVARQVKVWNRARRPIDTAALNPSYNTYTDSALDALLAAKSATTHGHTHNSTTSLQGGTTDQYYHTTAAQNTSICLLTAGETPITSNDSTTPARGQIFVRGATGWRFMPPGTDDYFLQTHGTGADPTWTALGGASLLDVGTTAGTVCAGDDGRLSDARTPTSHTHAHADTTSLQGGTTGQYYHVTAAQSAQITGMSAGETIVTSNDTGTAARGSILYRDATGWKYLAPGTADYHLATHGAGADPTWVSATAGAGDVTGPSSSVARQVARFDGVTGKAIMASVNYMADGGDFWIPEMATPSAPSGGYESIYPKAGGKWYTQTSGAVESCLATEFLVSAHTDLTTTAHGGIVASSDSRLSDARTPTTHASSHNAGGADALAIDAAAATGSLRTLGTSSTSACAGDDSRLSDARTPTTHVHTWGQTFVVATSGGTYTSIATAYAAAEAASPSATNRLAVLVYPGKYTEQLVMDTEYIDLIGIDPAASQIDFAGSGYTIVKSVSNATVKGMRVSYSGGEQASSGALNETTGSLTASFWLDCAFFSDSARTINEFRGVASTCYMENTKAASNNGYVIGDLYGRLISCQLEAPLNRGISGLKSTGYLEGCAVASYDCTILDLDGAAVNSQIKSDSTAIYFLEGQLVASKITSGVNGPCVTEVNGSATISNCLLSHGGSLVPIKLSNGVTLTMDGCRIICASSTYCLDVVSGAATVVLSNTSASKAVNTGTITVSAPTFLAAPAAHNQAWSTVTATPTTLAGYGIIDATPPENSLINGSCEVWQRSLDSTAVTTTRTYVADRWAVTTGAGTLAHVKRDTTVPTSSRARYSMELDGAAGITTVDVDQRIQAANIPRLARTVTFSAQLYNGSGGAFAPVLLMGTPAAADNFATVTVRNNGGSGDALQSCADAAWTQVTWTADISAYTNLAYGLEVKLRIPSGSCVASDTIRLTEIQLVPGSFTAPVYSCRQKSEEWFICEYYWQQSSTEGTPAGIGVNGQVSIFVDRANTSQVYSTQFLNRTMRAAPTITIYSPSDGESGHVRNVTQGVNSAAGGAIMYQNRTYWALSLNEGGINVGDNLTFQWSANAEL